MKNIETNKSTENNRRYIILLKKKKTINGIIFEKLRSTKLYHPNHEPDDRSKNEHATLPKDDNIIAGDECSKQHTFRNIIIFTQFTKIEQIFLRIQHFIKL